MSPTVRSSIEASPKTLSMQTIGEVFIESLAKHIERLKIPERVLLEEKQRDPVLARVDHITDIQNTMMEVLNHPITQHAQAYAENAFYLFLKKENCDGGVLRFFNGWNETHRTTSLVSAKIIMRLAADALSAPANCQQQYHRVMAHMHEVAKDDFGLGHKGHDGMYHYMTAAFGATDWANHHYKIQECNEFSDFLYETGVAKHKSAMNSDAHKKSIMNAMMIAIASELWNGREYNFIAQHENKLLAINPSLKHDKKSLRNAKGYVMGHAGEVENKHGLHALAAAQAYGRMVHLDFSPARLKEVMLNYNLRVGRAFNAMGRALISSHNNHCALAQSQS